MKDKECCGPVWRFIENTTLMSLWVAAIPNLAELLDPLNQDRQSINDLPIMISLMATLLVFSMVLLLSQSFRCLKSWSLFWLPKHAALSTGVFSYHLLLYIYKLCGGLLRTLSYPIFSLLAGFASFLFVIYLIRVKASSVNTWGKKTAIIFREFSRAQGLVYSLIRIVLALTVLLDANKSPDKQWRVSWWEFWSRMGGGGIISCFFYRKSEPPVDIDLEELSQGEPQHEATNLLCKEERQQGFKPLEPSDYLAGAAIIIDIFRIIIENAPDLEVIYFIMVPVLNVFIMSVMTYSRAFEQRGTTQACPCCS